MAVYLKHSHPQNILGSLISVTKSEDLKWSENINNITKTRFSQTQHSGARFKDLNQQHTKLLSAHS